uniref:Uncharacterized protein n=1 Tax=Micrurus lemniscatus lemniscatus TaxID=129467 RepID=A0A2D4I876_MICLE
MRHHLFQRSQAIMILYMTATKSLFLLSITVNNWKGFFKQTRKRTHDTYWIYGFDGTVKELVLSLLSASHSYPLLMKNTTFNILLLGKIKRIFQYKRCYQRNFLIFLNAGAQFQIKRTI